MIFVKILIGIAALALGIFLGLPGKHGPRAARGRRWQVHATRERGGRLGEHDERELEQLERDLGNPGGYSRRAKRHFTPIDLLKRKRRASESRRARRYFRTAAPTSRKDGHR
jgi:hypothetical protein